MKSNTSVALLCLGCIFLGMAVAPRPKPTVIKEEVPLQNLSDWQRLKELDDQGFQYCAQSSQYASDSIKYIMAEDVDGLVATTKKVNGIAQEITALSEERQSILSKLGY